jgi:hypothetical protein
VFFAFSFSKASAEPLRDSAYWEDQLRDLKINLKRTTLPSKQAEILKGFWVKLSADINSAKDMNSPIFEKKISLLNRMNALFLDKFQKPNCASIKARWALLKSSNSDGKFEAQQVDEWLKWICR